MVHLKIQSFFIFLNKFLKQGLNLQEDDQKKALLVSRKKKSEDTVVNIKGELIGNGSS